MRGPCSLSPEPVPIPSGKLDLQWSYLLFAVKMEPLSPGCVYHSMARQEF